MATLELVLLSLHSYENAFTLNTITEQMTTTVWQEMIVDTHSLTLCTAEVSYQHSREQQ